MSELLNAAKLGSYATTIQQNDEDLVYGIEKLLRMRTMLMSIYGEYILQVDIAPLSILRTKTSNIKKLSFRVIYRADKSDVFDSMRDEVTEFIKSITSDEFEGIEEVDVEYSIYMNYKIPVLTLYSAFDSLDIETLEDVDYAFIGYITHVLGYNVSIPTSFKYQYPKTVIIHTPNTIAELNLGSYLQKTLGDLYKISSVEENKHTNYVYDVHTGETEITYDIPYVYVRKFSLNKERLVSLGVLKEEIPTESEFE